MSPSTIPKQPTKREIKSKHKIQAIEVKEMPLKESKMEVDANLVEIYEKKKSCTLQSNFFF